MNGDVRFTIPWKLFLRNVLESQECDSVNPFRARHDSVWFGLVRLPSFTCDERTQALALVIRDS